MLGEPARKNFDLPVRHGVSLDDVPDEHPCFIGAQQDWAECEAEMNEQADPVRDGCIGKDGRP